MIIYIHGFASSAFGEKAQKLKEYFDDELIALSLPTIPNLAIANLEQLIESYVSIDEEVSLIGSSLGGFYSIYLANKYDLKAVLINPAVYPWRELHRYENQELIANYYDGSKFEFTTNHLNSFKNYKVDTLITPTNFLTLLQEGDEVLDFNEAAEYLESTELIIEEGGNHSFEEIERYFRKISTFFR